MDLKHASAFMYGVVYGALTALTLTGSYTDVAWLILSILAIAAYLVHPGGE